MMGAQTPEVGQVPRFPKALRAWKSDAFGPTLKGEIEAMTADTLPLHAGTSQGGLVDDGKLAATVLTVADDERFIVADVGIFFSEIVGGCSCGDEPESINAYCRMRIRIDKTTAEARIHPVSD